MSTIIVYASKYGTAEKCALILKDMLKDNVTVSNIKDVGKIGDLDGFDTIIIGCSINAGKIKDKAKKFVQQNLSLLSKKKVGLFLCSLTPPDKAGHYFQENFPGQLVQHAKARGLFGGELIYEKMNPFDRFILKKITKKDTSKSFIKMENIEQFAGQMNKA
jgi:menaquinone-dependent protoporphyrinogen oxidase